MSQLAPEIVPLDATDLLPFVPTAADRRSFRTLGHAHLDDLWDTGFRDRLADEARERRTHARVPDAGPRTPVEGRRRVRKPTPAATGPLLSRLHVSMTGVARTLSGRLLVPSFSSYGYYEGDDEVLLHLDTADCDVTLLTTALGRVGPLHLRPELRGRAMAELGRLEDDVTWDRHGGVQVDYPRLGLTALAGNTVPHNRPGRPITEPSAVAALCYRALF
ncbi:hypothetical protein ACFY8W_01975 [Streptomyces sp. NPDC012637]|uniref:hypothetical protein n=1 Tax=Streptomyces sp. NPDC012637 TaxID=3364842 RepID=UPI0036EEE358